MNILQCENICSFIVHTVPFPLGTDVNSASIPCRCHVRIHTVLNKDIQSNVELRRSSRRLSCLETGVGDGGDTVISLLQTKDHLSDCDK